MKEWWCVKIYGDFGLWDFLEEMPRYDKAIKIAVDCNSKFRQQFVVDYASKMLRGASASDLRIPKSSYKFVSTVILDKSRIDRSPKR